jgi:hypothetical protein
MSKLRILLGLPHVFAPREGSLYSSQTETKREVKQQALLNATIGNLTRHGSSSWVHASLGKSGPITTREINYEFGADIEIQLFTPRNATLADAIPQHPNLKRFEPDTDDYTQIPSITSRRLIEQAAEYDLIGYMEDDLLIEDREFFDKIIDLTQRLGDDYVVLPHRCERIPDRGDVILSGDPDGGRDDLFWDTGEKREIQTSHGLRQFYRATNPHSGCYFLTRQQALRAFNYWSSRNWKEEFRLSGPLEQAASGILLPIFKIMKPIPQHYRYLMILHQDELWKRHPFEEKETDRATKEEQSNKSFIIF